MSAFMPGSQTRCSSVKHSRSSVSVLCACVRVRHTDRNSSHAHSGASSRKVISVRRQERASQCKESGEVDRAALPFPIPAKRNKKTQHFLFAYHLPNLKQQVSGHLG